jgi:ribonuclease Y
VNWIAFGTLTLLGLVSGYLTYGLYLWYRRQRAQERAEEIRQEANSATEQTPEDVRAKQEQLEDYRDSLEDAISRLEDKIESQRDRIESVRERFESRQEFADKLQSEVDELRNRLNNESDELKSLREKRVNLLEEKCGANSEDLLSGLEDEILSQTELVANKTKSNIIEGMEGRKRKHSKRVINRVINRCDVTTPVEVPSAVLKFPDNDAFQQFRDFYEEHEERLIEDIDSDVRFDEEQDMAVIETLKPLKKEIAHRTLNNIIQQKKFEYDLIPEGVERYTRQVESEQERAAREAIKDAGLDHVPDELVDLLGVLKFRTSYGQQQLTHSLEVSHLGGLMASEIGADAQLTRRAGLLHDVGKAIDRQREQGHAVVGAELTEEAGENDVVVNAVGSHHGDMEANYVESILVAAADAISGSRPGVRRENVTDYSERIEALRELAGDRKGIKKVYAMSAGRELRIRVDRNVVQDQEMENLAKTIATEIEEELTYSGSIKVNTIRETKITETARNNDS